MVHEDNERFDLNIIVVTVSSSRELENDITGKKIQDIFSRDGYRVKRVICRDNESEILKSIFCNYDNDVFIFNGGTGASRLDVTVQSISRIAQKEIRGFGELFRERSGGILTHISNATLYLRDRKEIFCIPGSPDAAEVASEIIMKMMNHIYREMNKE